ncbi:MAG TPA: hypothetical protein VLB27_10025, partial [candidate division Zixibacteria bacterium]|nr:hypothetical protein [candidate division Zixibacteria bacterium]
HGAGGLTITDTGGSYTAKYTYDPGPAQTLGLYDLYCEVSDGTDNVIDGFSNNLDELEINETVANSAPVIAVGATAANPISVARFGASTTQLSVVFTDSDQPGVGAFAATFKLREPFSTTVITVADALGHGQGGLTITDGGGGSYTAAINWNPSDNATVGEYDLYCRISDGTDFAVDDFADNLNELTVTSAGENSPPVVPSDATYATPAAVERIGANPTTLMATFTDSDQPGVSAFIVSFKIRDTNNVDEIVLANNVGNGVGGVTITDDGGGVYTASVNWDPPDAQALGYYDLYFHVTDGTADTSYDGFMNNLDELAVYDAVSNNAPTIVAGNTTAIPASITRLGSEYTM